MSIKLVYDRELERKVYLFNMAYRKYNDYHRINTQGVEEKQCKECLQWFLMDNNNFGTDKGNKDGFNMLCKSCQKEYNNNNYMKNREKQIEQATQWKKDNPERYKELMEKVEAKPSRKQDNRKRAEKQRKAGKQAEWQRNNKDKLRQYGIEKHQHKISEKEWKACKGYFDNCCAYCGLPIAKHYYTRKEITKLGDFHKEHKDHYGADDLSNCIPACGSCNEKKWKFEFDEWYNSENPVYSKERYDRIIKWITEDYKLYIREKVSN